LDFILWWRIVLGQLVARIRAQELAERQREERATALYHLTREFAQAGTRDEVVWQLVAEVNRVFRARWRWCCLENIRWPRIRTVRSC
jgi:K+-sensing histidine kinase KdpD